jgi:transposase-like protein
MSKYSPEVKAAVMAALLQGQSINSVAREYDIPPGTISNWKNRDGVPKSGIQKKQEEIGELLIKLLHTNLVTLEIQSKFFQTEAWLNKQDAAGVAVLHGVVTDKSVRLLEAMSSNVPNDNDS